MREKLFFLIFIFNILAFPNLYSDETCFILSRKLKPYIEMVNGFSEKYKGSVRIFDISKNKNINSSLSSCNIIVAAGNNANVLLKNYRSKGKLKIFTFLIYKNEAKDFVTDNKSFAIYLYPPPEKIIKFFKRDNITSLIAPYSNKRAGIYLKKAYNILKKNNIYLNFFKIDSFNNFEKVLNKNKGATLWILPDSLYSSVEVINYLIEKCTLFKVNTIGYNKYFYNAGATYSIVVDYVKIGNLINTLLKKDLNHIMNAPFKTIGD